MNILFLTYQGDIAGSTNSISYLAQGLAERGHNIYVGCRKESLLYSMLQNTEVNLMPMTFRSKVDFQNMSQIRDAVQEYDIQFINAQSSKDRYTSILAKWRYRLNVKIVFTRRQDPKDMSWLKNKFIEAGADRIVVISHGLKDIFIKKGVPEKLLSVVHNGIPANRFDQWSSEKVDFYKKKFGIKDEDKVIGSVSRMKNQDQIIRAVAKLKRPEMKLLFAGITREDVDDVIQETGIKNEIIFAGVIPGEDILNIYRLMSIKILASTMDGFGLALLEAMAMDVPVIATNFGGIKDVVQHNYNGFLFEDGDIDQLAGRITTLIEDKEVKQKFIIEGRKTAYEKFTMEKTVAGYERLFEKIMEA